MTITGAGAAAASATVATPPSPPRSVVTFAPSADTVTPVTAPTVSAPLSAVPSKYAVNVTLRAVGVPRVKIRNAWLVEPAGTRSSPGKRAAIAGSLLENRTTASGCAGQTPVGIGPLKVSVPPELPPPATELGEIVIDVSFGSRFGGRTKNGRFEVAPPLVANTNTSTSVVSDANVVTGKLTLRPPSGTVTLAGTLAIAGCVLDNVTMVPPAGAA